jgi:hypothetical protein
VLDPVDAVPRSNRGLALTALGSAGARERFARVQGRVTGCTAFRTAELEALAICGLGQPEDAEKHPLRYLPRRTPGDLTEPRGLYDLLSDPLLQGIDRLRVLVETDV